MNGQSVVGQLYYGTMVKPELLAVLFKERLTERELQLLINIDDYLNADSQAGLPGHNLMVLVSKLMGIMQVERDEVWPDYSDEEIFDCPECYPEEQEDTPVASSSSYDFGQILQEILSQYGE